MKVAILTPYSPPAVGGITTYVRELARELAGKYGFEILVISREGQEGPGVVVLGGTGAQFVRRAAPVLERFSPDVVHAHGHWYTLQAGLRYRRRHPAVRAVFTLHTAFRQASWWRRHGLTVLLSRADFVTSVSADLLNTTLRSIAFRSRTRVTHPGVRMPPTDTSQVREFLVSTGLANRKPVIGYMGGLSWEEKVRGVAHLIRAMRTVRGSFPSSTLIVAGDGPLRRDLEALAEREVPGAVRFLGELTNPGSWFFGAVELYAHISFQEGLPLTLLEAMASRKPVVASATGGIGEVVRQGRNGILVSGDPTEIAGRILDILSSPELARRLADNAADDAASRFSWSRAAERFLAPYGVPARHRVAITLDLERDYRTPKESFDGVEKAVPRLLDLFEKHHVPATFFTTSDLCARFSEALREIRLRGYTIGCHGESHATEYLCRLSYERQAESLRHATEVIEKCVGDRPRAFRAPNFSANGDTLRVLEQLGYDYDSSVLPGRVVRFNRLVPVLDFLVAPRDPYQPSHDNLAVPGGSGLWELPLAENPLGPGGPIGLGFVNAHGAEKALEAIACSAGDPCVFLIHPWELIDPPLGDIPFWMRGACTSDSSELDAFLSRLRIEHDLTTLEKEFLSVR